MSIMFTIRRDKEKCVNCGNCEAILPKIMAKTDNQHGLMVSYTMLEKNAELIQQVIDKCHLRALEFVDFE